MNNVWSWTNKINSFRIMKNDLKQNNDFMKHWMFINVSIYVFIIDQLINYLKAWYYQSLNKFFMIIQSQRKNVFDWFFNIYNFNVEFQV
jgi:hypothetical protein